MDEKKKEISKLKGEERIRSLDKWFTTAFEAEKEFVAQAEEDEKFYMGDQWDPRIKNDLEQAGKPALTYNYIFSLVNLVNGYHRQNKLDLKVFNTRAGSRDVAEILSKLMKHTKQTKNGDWEIAHAHLMGLIAGKAYIGLGVDYDEDLMNGELYLEFIPYCDILVDPFGSRYDLADRDYYFKSVWMPKAKIERMYPDKVKDGFQVMDSDKLPITGVETHNYSDAAKYQEQGDEEVDNYRYRVKECWWKEYVENRLLINIQTGSVNNVNELKLENIKRIITLKPEYRLVKRVKPVLHLAQYMGLTELNHTEKPMGGMTNFPIVPFYPYFFRKGCQGVVTQLKDPQREHNKRISQALHHLNQSANSGYIADADAVEDWDELEKNISVAGYIKKIKKGARFEKDHPIEISQGHIILAAQGRDAIKLVSGVNSDLLGENTSETVSGVAIARRQAQGLMTTEIVHDNMKLTMKILGDRMIEAIQKSGAYSKEEVLRIVIDGDEDEIAVNQKVQGAQKVLNDLTIGRYETVVQTSMQTPTARFANYMALLDAIKIGAPIPPEILVDASDWPEKEKIKKAIAEQKVMQAKAVEAQLAEKQKDRDSKLTEIETKNRGEMLRDAQKKHLEVVAGNGKEPKKD